MIGFHSFSPFVGKLTSDGLLIDETLTQTKVYLLDWNSHHLMIIHWCTIVHFCWKSLFHDRIELFLAQISTGSLLIRKTHFEIIRPEFTVPSSSCWTKSSNGFKKWSDTKSEERKWRRIQSRKTKNFNNHENSHLLQTDIILLAEDVKISSFQTISNNLSL